MKNLMTSQHIEAIKREEIPKFWLIASVIILTLSGLTSVIGFWLGFPSLTETKATIEETPQLAIHRIHDTAPPPIHQNNVEPKVILLLIGAYAVLIVSLSWGISVSKVRSYPFAFPWARPPADRVGTD